MLLAGMVNVVVAANELASGALPFHCLNHCPAGAVAAVIETVAPGAKLAVEVMPLPRVPLTSVTV